MLWKLLLTAGLILVAYLVLKARQGRARAPGRDPGGPPPVARPTRRLAMGLAYGALAVMFAGSGWYLWQGRVHANRVLEVQVVNAGTGAIVSYRARRKDIDGRVLRTLDGREVRLADVERMILIEPGPDRRSPAP